MSAPDYPRSLSFHAIDRYRQRVERAATSEAIHEVFEAAKLRKDPPGDVQLAHASAWYATTEHVVFPVIVRMLGGKPFLVATTCVRRKKRSKAARRAWREAQRGLGMEE